MTRRFLVALGLFAIALLLFERDLSVEYLRGNYATAPSTFVDVAGMEVHVRDEGEGRPLVLLHGTASSLHTWDDWTALLSDSLRIIRFDLPGFGLTGPREDGDYRIENYVEFLGALLDSLDLPMTSLAGNSLGGHIAWAFASRYPDRVDRLVLIDPSGYPDAPANPLVFRLAKLPLIGGLVQWVDPSPFVRRSMQDVYGDPLRLTERRLDRYRVLALGPGNRRAFVDRVRTEPDWPFAATQQVRAPVLIQWGELDTWTPFDNAQGYAAAFSDSRLIAYPGAGHVPMEEIPVPTARDARRFLLGD